MTLVNRISFRAVLPAAVAVALFSFSPSAQPQDQQSSSVADAARRAREQKKKSEKPARVIDDDNLPPAPSAASAPVIQTATAAQLGTSTQAATPPAEVAPPEKKESSDKAAEAAAMKAHLEELKKDLDLLQREVPLARDNFYSKPDYAHDRAGQAKLDALMQQITDKQQDVDVLKARLAALLEQLAKEQPASAGSPEKPTTPPQP